VFAIGMTISPPESGLLATLDPGKEVIHFQPFYGLPLAPGLPGGRAGSRRSLARVCLAVESRRYLNGIVEATKMKLANGRVQG
jgi:hypothetical protein